MMNNTSIAYIGILKAALPSLPLRNLPMALRELREANVDNCVASEHEYTSPGGWHIVWVNDSRSKK